MKEWEPPFVLLPGESVELPWHLLAVGWSDRVNRAELRGGKNWRPKDILRLWNQPSWNYPPVDFLLYAWGRREDRRMDLLCHSFHKHLFSHFHPWVQCPCSAAGFSWTCSELTSLLPVSIPLILTLGSLPESHENSQSADPLLCSPFFLVFFIVI